MAQRNYITGNEVPQGTGDAEEDLGKLRDYLFKMASQLEFELGNLEKRIEALEKAQ